VGHDAALLVGTGTPGRPPACVVLGANAASDADIDEARPALLELLDLLPRLRVVMLEADPKLGAAESCFTLPATKRR
jgi:hypothetical protein